jgi:hypothetical protein
VGELLDLVENRVHALSVNTPVLLDEHGVPEVDPSG